MPDDLDGINNCIESWTSQQLTKVIEEVTRATIDLYQISDSDKLRWSVNIP